MFKRLKFAFTYALRNIIRDRQRTAFALLSIAAGVATVVALRMLGLMLTDALTSNAQAILRADVTAEPYTRAPRISFLQNSSNSNLPITSKNQDYYDQWAATNHYDIQFAMTSELMQAAVVHGDTAGRPAFTNSFFIDPKIYPFYDHIVAEDPAGVPLSALLTGPDQVVIAHRLAAQLGAKVGDTLRVGAAASLQTVRGIVPDTSESNLEGPMNLLFSFVYLDRAHTDQFGLPAGAADKVFVRVPPGKAAQSVANQMYGGWVGGNHWRIITAPRVLMNNEVAANLVSRFVLLLSLVALVIGGVGIINTMLVSVNRRSGEIAVLKTLGLRGSNVGLLFFAEALLLGVVGSLLGLVIGLLLSLVAQQFGQQAFNVTLPWHFNVEPMLLGLALGIIITAVFSIFPALLAAQVRPGNVLRVGSIPLQRAGCLTSLVSLVVMLATLSALSEAIIGDARNVLPGRGLPFSPRAPVNPQTLPYGLIGTLSVFVLIVVMLVLIWVFVWLLGKLPSLRNPNFRIAIRALTLHRGRTALSLLALIIGMTALSATLIGTRSLTMLLETTASEPLGGNVVILPFLPLSSALVHAKLDTASGVSGYRDVRFFNSDLLSIDGNRNFDEALAVTDDVQRATVDQQMSILLGMDVHGSPPRGKLVAGRYLGPEDSGKYHIVVPDRPELAPLNVHVGSTFEYRLGTSIHDFEVVGMVAPDDRAGLIPFSLGDSAVQAPIDIASGAIPFDLIIASVDKNAVNDVMASTGAVTGIFVFDVSVFDSIINRILTQMAALPLLVAGLSLFAATVLIATTVSLATLERRRQIAILKALGVTRTQALNQLLLENAIVGAAGGLISLIPTLLVLALVPVLTGDLGFTVHLPVPVDLIVLMLALSIVITLGATLLSAWSASGEKPLAALRYE